MTHKNWLTIAFLFFITLFSSAQQANNWFFGNNAGLNFNTTPPTTLSVGQSTIPDNCSTISDANGNLLFYTDGVTVWNNTHAAMLNGTGLIGNYTAGQCAVIIPIPCQPDKYVIFHTTEFASPGYLHYTVVDMSLNSGLGDVVSIQKNISLGSGWTEKLCAYYNPVNKNYWVLTHKWNSAEFVAFDVNATSIAVNSVTSTVGSSHTCGTYSGVHDAMGQLTISKNGTKVLNALTCQDKYELFNFNSVTGVLSNPLSIPGTGYYAWATAFSPDDTKIYVNSIFGTSIYQYDISSNTATTIVASQIAVATVTTSGYNFGYMELGPDNKLYIARPSQTSLAVINSPNLAGASCNFSLSGQSLGTRSSSWGLSRIAYNIPSNYNGLSIASASTATICPGGSVTFSASGPGSYTWTPSSSLSSSSASLVSANPLVTTSYSLSTIGSTCTSPAVITITVFPLPTITIASSAYSLCSPGSSVTLTASGGSSYTWNPASLLSSASGTMVSANPVTTTNYSLVGSNGTCTANSALTITVFPQPTITISSSAYSLCSPGNSVILTASGGSSYTWNPASSLSSVSGSTVSANPITTTNYSLSGSNGTCTANSAITISVFLSPTITIAASSYSLCSLGSSVTLTASGGSSYTWSPASSLSSVSGSTVSANPITTTNYSLSGSNGTCTANSAITITVFPQPTITIAASSYSLCFPGSSVALTASGGSSYTWSPTSSLSSASGTTVSANPLTTTSYSLVGSNGSCTANSMITISVFPQPTVTIASSSSFFCSPGIPVTLLAAGASTYSWSPVLSLSSSTAQIVSANPLVTTTYSLTGSNGLCTASSTIAISVFSQPTLAITPSSYSLCAQVTAITITATGASNYTWSPAVSLSSSTTAIVFANPIITTTYSLSGANGDCKSNSAVTISVFPLPVIIVSGPTKPLCSGQATTLLAGGANSFSWNTGQTGATVTVSPISNTIYTVTGTDNQGCTNKSVFTVSVTLCEGINGKELNSFVRVYPNPSKGLITIESPDNSAWKNLVVIDGTGKVVYNLTSNILESQSRGAIQIDLRSLNKGLYFLKGNYQEQVFTHKLIME